MLLRQTRTDPQGAPVPTITALLVSSFAAYLPVMLFGDSLSTGAEIFSSLIVGTIAYALTLWYMTRLRDGL